MSRDHIPISAAEAIGKRHGYDQVIIYARRVSETDGLEWVTTWGKDETHCEASARIGDAIRDDVTPTLERLRADLERARCALREVQLAAGRAMEQHAGPHDALIAEFLATVHRTAVSGLVLGEPARNETADQAAETKDFPTEDVISAVTGYLVTERLIGAVYEVLGWMTSGPVWTHQLPRIGKEAAPVLLRLHPELAEAYEEAKQVTPENCREFLARWRERYGPTLCVPRMTADEHERIDPLSELAEKVHPDRIIAIDARGEDHG